MAADDRSEIWKREAEFFDHVAEKQGANLRPLRDETLYRYGTLRRRRFNKEYRFRLMGDLHGKRVLDVGCGDGLNAVLLAALGATVTGVDISPGAIELARKRAEVNHVAERCTFTVSPLEEMQISDGGFDIVWGDAFLHHVLHDLPAVLDKLASLCSPTGLLIFTDPVNRASWLRRFRLALPIAAEASDDERPLLDAELDLVNAHLRDAEPRAFNLFMRLSPFVLRPDYESSPWLLKRVVDLIAALDWLVLSIPGLDRLGGVRVTSGHPARAAAPPR